MSLVVSYCFFASLNSRCSLSRAASIQRTTDQDHVRAARTLFLDVAQSSDATDPNMYCLAIACNRVVDVCDNMLVEIAAIKSRLDEIEKRLGIAPIGPGSIEPPTTERFAE